MKTIHIYGFGPEDWLLKELYKKFLRTDNLWHFVYWKDFWTHKAFIEGKNLLLRIENTKIVKQVTNYLWNEGIQFDEYDFPFCRGKYQLGISRLSWEARHLDLALPMLHIISLARVKLGNGFRYRRFINQYFHIAFNVGSFDHMDEADFCVKLLSKRMELVKKMYRNKGKWR